MAKEAKMKSKMHKMEAKCEMKGVKKALKKHAVLEVKEKKGLEELVPKKAKKSK